VKRWPILIIFSVQHRAGMHISSKYMQEQFYAHTFTRGERSWRWCADTYSPDI